MAGLNWFSAIFNPILDPVFGILLKLPPFFGIFIITLIVTSITIIVYKKMTNQEMLKSIREEMKTLREQMKTSQSDAQKLAELQKISMQKSMMQMKETMKPMLITMIPILIIFGWFATHLAYYPILPDHEFNATLMFKDNINGNVEIIIPNEIQVLNGNTQNITKKVDFVLKGKEGDFNLEFRFNNKSYTKDVLITNDRKYKDVQKLIGENLSSISINNKPITVFGLSWFWTYIILAILLNSALRKLLKVY
ncbi:DUF106 domain-containing protein [Candidatus Woesearchaeota archaeon]|nr:DUF106 domain-containing protein [Candidatus Woesearchaeota archaeon]